MLHRSNSRGVAQAFTLVELLVVIGIIALLISILLPALQKAKKSAQNVQCLSNIRQLAQAMNLYANEYRGQIPIGFLGLSNRASRVYQRNYQIYANGIGSATELRSFPLWGRLYQARLINRYVWDGVSDIDDQAAARSLAVFGCPSETHPSFQVPGEWNRFPPGRDPADPTRAGYMLRPVVASQFSGETSTSEPVMWHALPNGDVFRCTIPPVAAAVLPLPKISQFRGRKAIISDTTIREFALKTRHAKHVNFGFTDGSAVSVPASSAWTHPTNGSKESIQYLVSQLTTQDMAKNGAIEKFFVIADTQ